MVDSRAAAFSSTRRPEVAPETTAPGLSVSRRPSGGKWGVRIAEGDIAALWATSDDDFVAIFVGVGTEEVCPVIALCKACQSGSLPALIAGVGATDATTGETGTSSGASMVTVSTGASPSNAARKAEI